MDPIINKLKESIDSGLPFDLEVLLDDLVEATKLAKADTDELLHAQGRSFQQLYDSKINLLKSIIGLELLNLKSQSPSSLTHYQQSIYRLLKQLLQILNDIPTIF